MIASPDDRVTGSPDDDISGKRCATGRAARSRQHARTPPDAQRARVITRARRRTPSRDYALA
jgi:hypothetical protein